MHWSLRITHKNLNGALPRRSAPRANAMDLTVIHEVLACDLSKGCMPPVEHGCAASSAPDPASCSFSVTMASPTTTRATFLIRAHANARRGIPPLSRRRDVEPHSEFVHATGEPSHLDRLSAIEVIGHGGFRFGRKHRPPLAHAIHKALRHWMASRGRHRHALVTQLLDEGSCFGILVDRPMPDLMKAVPPEKAESVTNFSHSTLSMSSIECRPMPLALSQVRQIY
jgi:hypothetical protein